MLIDMGSRRIYYDLTGPEGAPVVCLTHSLASDSGMWAEQMPPLLAAGYRVLRLDMRGHGGSDTVDGPYTMEQLGGDVAAALSALGLERVHLIGLSIGGMIGQAVAIKHTSHVASLMLCDTLPGTPEGGQAAWAPRIEAVRNANSVAPLADPTMDRWFTPAFQAARPARWKEIHATVAATPANGYLGCAAAILSFDFKADLPSISVPTLVVCGDGDEGTPPAANRLIADRVQNGRYEEIANARHFPNVERTDAFNALMMDWLKVNAPV